MRKYSLIHTCQSENTRKKRAQKEKAQQRREKKKEEKKKTLGKRVPVVPLHPIPPLLPLSAPPLHSRRLATRSDRVG